MNNTEKKQFSIFFIPVIISMVIAEIILLLSSDPDIIQEETIIVDAGMIALIVAVIGVAGGIWAQLVQFKRDSNRLNGFGRNIVDVKSDTDIMKPEISHIDENVKKIRDKVIENIVPDLAKLDGVTTLVDAYKVDKALKERYSPALTNIDVLKGSIELVYERNSVLEAKCNELMHENTLLKNERDGLLAKVNNYERVYGKKNIEPGLDLER